MLKLRYSHEQCWELIPWVVNGQAKEADQHAVLTHVESCNECREELERHRALSNHMRGNEDVIAAPNASWQKLLAQVDAQPETRVAKKYRISRPWLVAALWLQLVAIAALVGALLSSTPRPAAEYTTLSAPQAAEEHAAIRVVFSPDAQLDEINRLLRSVECGIVAGPSEAGVYTLATAAGKDIPGVIASLRERSEVLFAERAQADAGTVR